MSEEEARSMLERLHHSLPSRAGELYELVGRTPLGVELIAGKLHTHSSSRLLARFAGRSHRLRSRKGAFPLEEAISARLQRLGDDARALLIAVSTFEGVFEEADAVELSSHTAKMSNVGALLRALLASELLLAEAKGFVVNRPARDYARAQKTFAAAEVAHTRFFVDRCQGWSGHYDSERCRTIAVDLKTWSADLAKVHGRLAVQVRGTHDAPADATAEEPLLWLTEALERLLRDTASPTFADALTVTIDLCTGAAKVEALLLRSWNRLVVGGDGGEDAVRALELLHSAPATAEASPRREAVRQEAKCLQLWCRVCDGEQDEALVDALVELGATSDATPRVRAEAYAAAARVRLRQGQWPDAEALYEEAIRWMTTAGAAWRLGRLQYRMAMVCYERGDLGAGRRAARRAEDVAERLGDRGVVGATRRVVALIAAEEAQSASEASAAFSAAFRELERCRAWASPRDIAFALRVCGMIALQHGRASGAFFEAAVQLDGRTSHGGVRAAWLLSLSKAAAGDSSGAREELERVVGLPDALMGAVRTAIGADLGEVCATREHGALGRVVARVLSPSPLPGAWVHESAGAGVRADGSEFQVNAEPIEVRSPVLRRVLAALVLQRLKAPMSPLSTHELFDCVWPGDEAHPDQRTTRVYVAIHELRQLGLDAHIESSDGYRLSSDAGAPTIYL